MDSHTETSELRWQPLLREWVVVAANRQDRPQMPAHWCPFCPGSGRVPESYDVWLYPNDFPAFTFANPPYDPREEHPFGSTGAPGACDVVLYSPHHTLPPSQLPVDAWEKVINLWKTRTAELFAQPAVQYVCVFENTGEAIGVTMPHPHGQIYAMPFVPPLVRRELASAKSHFEDNGECLYCSILKGELAAEVRLVASNGSFVAFVPYAGRFPTEVQLYARRHFANLSELSQEEEADLAAILSAIRKKYDGLYGFLMPLMMLVRQAPSQGEHPYFHFHIEFLPLQRSATKLKYLASIESGCGTFLNDTRAEEEAPKLRQTAPAMLLEEEPKI